MSSYRSRVPSVRCPCWRRSVACSTSSASVTPVTRSLGGGEVHPDLEALLVLQEKDQAVTATDAARDALAPELRALDDAQAVPERALAAAHAALQAASAPREGLRGQIAANP